MPFSSLHTIELQLCMQFCDAHSLLRLARCCTGTLHAASCAFAWLGASPMRLTFTQDETDLSERIFGSRLLSHTHFAIEWHSTSRHQPLESDELDGLLRLPRVDSLDARGWLNSYRHGQYCMDERDWLRVLTAPLMSGLRALHVGHRSGPCVLDAACMAAIATHLRGLETLHVWHDGRFVPGLYGAHLSALPALMDLLVTANLQADPMESVGACLRLRTLGINFCRGEVVSSVLLSPQLSLTLRELHLRSLWCGEHIQWDQIFQSLRRLRTLSLRSCVDVEAVLTQVTQRCKRLTQLTVEPVRFNFAHMIECRPLIQDIIIEVPHGHSKGDAELIDELTALAADRVEMIVVRMPAPDEDRW